MISLIICARNEEKLIGRCLDSVMRSSYRFHEVIVVDNGSIDNTARIARSYSDVTVVTEPKPGLSVARQRGYLESTGDIMAYADADVVLPRNWGTRIANYMYYDDVAAVSGPVDYPDLPNWQRWAVKWLWWNGAARATYHMTGYMLMGANFAIRRKVVQRIGGIPQVEFYGEDTALGKAAAKFGSVQFIFDLVVEASGRRLLQQGLVSTVWTYALNYLRPGATNTHEDYR